MRHEARKTLAYSWIGPLVATLYCSLLLSIGVFIAGLLYQLRNLSTSFDRSAPILETTWILGVALIAFVVGTITATKIHATRYESSPFEGILSNLLVKLLRAFQQRWGSIGKWRVGVDWESGRDLFKTYMASVAEATAPKFLDRMAPAFSQEAWIKYGEGSIDIMERAYDRLMATVTSIRVRETIRAQISRFAEFCRDNRSRMWDETIRDYLLIFLRNPSSFAPHFPAWATILSIRENNEDLFYIGALPVEECVAKLLCTYDQDHDIGDRNEIFEAAVGHCNTLIADGNEHDVMRILSHVDRLSLIRSFMRAPDPWLDYSPDFFPFLISILWPEILLYTNKFHKDLSLFDDIDLSPMIATVAHHPSWRPRGQISSSLTLYLLQCEPTTLSSPIAILRFLQLRLDPKSSDEDGYPLHTSEETRFYADHILDPQFRPNIFELPPSRSPSPSLDGALPSNSRVTERPSEAPEPTEYFSDPPRNAHSPSLLPVTTDVQVTSWRLLS
ncbi:hypothetical protein SISSUDRAFT_1067659 [Sistotremastrum suecicum HHB10207 ss-3]|uniref:Uncharacterized protein n=1 Tax=Sistotremastrum suecicum HHB10207 ss-3 TaxID=1314776 RepID=A0A165WVJ0_9AGAM|nr:hypothetical protein SISSUDRAFT_1067659 [Sistotremastrum suecicum HHB10207 ss-3]